MSPDHIDHSLSQTSEQLDPLPEASAILLGRLLKAGAEGRWRKRQSCFLTHWLVVLIISSVIVALHPSATNAQYPNPTWMTATPSSQTIPGYITYCTDTPNTTVDLRYYWNGGSYEADSGVTFDSGGCTSVYYNYDGWAGNYQFTAIRNSANGSSGSWSSINTYVTLYPTPAPPSISYFYSNDSSINQGNGTYLFWSSNNAVYAYINGQYVSTSGWLYVTPSTTTTYTLVVYNSAWQQTSSSVTVSVIPLYDNAYMSSQSVPSPMSQGTTYTVSVSMTNNGTTTWQGTGYHLDSQNPAENTTWGINHVYLNSGETIPPGYTKTFTFTIHAPTSSGSYNFQWQMVHDGVGFFGSPSVNVTMSPVPQPTSMSFSPTAVNAGNGTYTLTVGNGANMQIDFQYTWSGNPGVVYTVHNWTPVLNASGQAVVTVNHGDPQGTNQFTKIKNSLASEWVTLTTQPTFTILPPQPFASSLAVSPSNITPQTAYTMTVGNAGGITADLRYTFNELAEPYIIGWPTFQTATDGTTGTVTVTASTCTAVGNDVFTGIRNTNLPNQSDANWIAESARMTVYCPGAPLNLSVSPSVAVAGQTSTVTITGQNLCSVSSITSPAAITFSNFIPISDFSGTSETVTVHVDAAVASGTYPFTITTPCGQGTGSINVNVNNAGFVSQSVPSVMIPGSSNQVSITITNTGTSTWTPQGNYRLGSQNPTGSTTWGFSSVALSSSDAIAPGASKTFTFTVVAPSAPGYYNFQWQMMQNSISFGDATPNVVVGVGSPPMISSITPGSGNQGQHDFQIVISGSNLGKINGSSGDTTLSTPSGGHVAFAISPSPTISSDQTQLTAVMAIANDAPLQTIPITVTTPGGSLSVNFSVTSPNTQGQPQVTSISPGSMLSGTTQTFKLMGSNLTNANVSVGSSTITVSAAHVGDTELDVTVSSTSTPPGTYSFNLSVPQYGVTTVAFLVVDSSGRPTIDSITPNNPSAGGVYYFHLTGKNLTGANIFSDNPNVHILLGAAQVQNVTQAPSDYEIVVGILAVDANVLSTSANIVVQNASGQTLVPITIGDLTTITELQVQDGKLMAPFTTSDKRSLNSSVILGAFGGCYQGCGPTEIGLESFQVGIPFIQCGNNAFDLSCLKKIKMGNPVNLHIGFIGVSVKIYATIGFERACADYSGCFCVPEPCDLTFGIKVTLVLPLTKTLQFTKQLPNFLLAGQQDCTTDPRACADTINVVDLPQPTQICAGLFQMTFSGIFNFAPGATCANVTPGLNAKLTATPPTVNEGSPTLLSWIVSSSSEGNLILIHHVHITDDVNDPPYDCGDQFGDVTPCDPSQSVALTPTGTTTYSATFSGTSGGVADFFPSPDSPAQITAAQAHVTVRAAFANSTTFISPPIICLKSGGTSQLIPTDAQGNSLAQFPQGTTFSTVTLANPAQNGQDTASINQTGLVTGNPTPGVVLASAFLPDHTYLNNYKSGFKPYVQVGPMRLYLRFLPDAISFMKGSFPGSGLSLSDSDVASIESAVAARVQTLFSAANVAVMLSQPPGWGVPDANTDAVVTVDILAQKDSNGNFMPPRTYSDTTTVIGGDAVVNDLDFLPAFFGGDALSPGAGVFINSLPLIDLQGMRVSNDLIANGIANLAAHEIGHALGLVPNSSSQTLATQIGDNRFSVAVFYGDPNHHASSGIMQTSFSGVSLDKTPVVLTTGFSFNDNDNAYLAAILPR
ncbi:MAG: NBR1-Ig-like domain-containing protein [Acidobacteriia bacterium]|nr:NBR1-Ig-like domain-containing protein [Terriglobia bacterium]